MFEHALRMMGVEAEQVVFLDDIGSNLKAAAQLNIRCIKVRIGKEVEAVDELGRIMKIKLRMDEYSRL